MTASPACTEEEGISEEGVNAEESSTKVPQLLPADWATAEERVHNDLWGERLLVPEWEEQEQNELDTTTLSESNHRSEHGWIGRDLIHDREAPVRVTKYFLKFGAGAGLPPSFSQGGIGTTLTGIVHFTERSESHAGLCHGGSMTSVLDDVVGWVSFCLTGEVKAWSGCTVQINTQLLKPISVHSTLMVQARITRIERRKVWVEAEILDPTQYSSASRHGAGTYLTHAKCEGLVVINRGVLPLLPTQESSMSIDQF